MSKHDLPEGVAIIGLAGRFPSAGNADEFWRNLISGRDCITRFSDAELAAAGYDPRQLRSLPGYVGARGLVDRPEWFDRAFFGISPKEAEVLDPQQRVFLEVGWEALEDAGCDPSRFPGLIGVFAGMSNNTYYQHFVRQRKDLLDAVGIVNAVIANEKDFLTTRLAYKLNLRGPALNIQTACSSSLVSVCVAAQQLLDHQCDAALAGGVSLTFPQARGYFYQEGGMTSADGWCRPFDAKATGTIFSSGAGVVVLKRIEDALADGDQIYAVIRGQALNNDGAQKVSFAAPSIDGHTEVIAMAQAFAGVAPESISYIEAHGTATPLGDPIEVAGLTQVFRASTEARAFCALASVKGNIGHLDAASGIASLIKTALAFRHGQIPPTIHCEEPNAALHLEETPFYLNTALRDWPRGPEPRRAGVSSFGVGGTNAHVVLEESPAPSAAAAPEPEVQFLVLSAKTATALTQRALDLAGHLEANPAESLASVAFTLEAGRQKFPHRRAVVATRSTAAAALREAPKLHRVDDRLDTSVAFLFPGQGSQYAKMGAQLYASEPAFCAALDECAEALLSKLGLDLRKVLFEPTEENSALLNEARVAQPAIYAMNCALGRLWLDRGLTPVAMIGHSVGEFAAATLAGVFSMADGARVVAARAELVQSLPRGAMLAARIAETEAEKFLVDSRLSLAAANSPRLCVLSGPVEAIEAAEKACVEGHIPARRLATSHAFHSAMVEPVVAPFEAVVRGVQLNGPSWPIVSTVTGDWLAAAEATDPAYWARHLRATVRFADALGKLLDAHACACLEVGPGAGLTQLARQHPSKKPHHDFAFSIIEDLGEHEAIAAAVARLWLCGVPLDSRRLHGAAALRRVSLPAYPFERQRYFADLPAGLPLPLTTAATDGDLPLEAEALSPSAAAPSAASLGSVGSLRSLDPAPSPESSPSAAPTIAARLNTLLADLSGADLSSAAPETNLLELGFDSLFLSHAAITISRTFGVKIAFRQMLRELGTLGALAAYLEEHAPAAPTAAAPISTLHSQLPTPSDAAHGPFRPLQRQTSAALTDSQSLWLHGFITRYNARTAASKSHTEANRRHFSDPRAVAGFKQIWKEMVYPIVVNRSNGAYLWDLDGNRWTDLTLSFGAAMLGHQPPFLVEALKAQIDRGFEIGPTSPLAAEVSALLCELTGMERAAFCNTGSEAVTGAIRIARTVTGRPRIAYFVDSYHGISDEVLGRRSGNGVAPIAPGIPAEALSNAMILEYGSDEALAQIAAHANDLAAILVEPVQSRRPGFQPREFLHRLRALTAQHGIALVFDEIITGFRCHLGGAQAFFGVKADIATYGKVIAGGLPMGAIAGRAEYLDAFDGGAWRFGDDSFPGAAMTFFAGTFVRHPLALAAARAVLLHLKEAGPSLQEGLGVRAGETIDGINRALAGTPITAARFGSNWLLHTEPEFKFPGLLFALLRHRGLHLWENRPCFISTAHTAEDLDQVIAAFAESAAELADAGLFQKAANPTSPATAPSPDDPNSSFVPATAGSFAIRHSSFPISDSQREVWALCQWSPEASASCNECWTLDLRGPLDVSAFVGALQGVAARHASLRSSFDRSGESLIVSPDAVLEIPILDFSDRDETGREAELTALRQAESARTFDLKRAPLLTLHLVRLEPAHHALVFNAHHLICDGWSCDIFLREAAELYSASVESRPPRLPTPDSPQAYQQWETGMQATPEFTADAEYWVSRFRTIPTALEIPGDRPRPFRRSYRGGSETLVLPAEFPKALQQMGARRGATLFSVLFSGFVLLLRRLSNQHDLVVGVPSAGQSLAGTEHLISHCVNLLPIRIESGGARLFSDLLSLVQSNVVDAFDHRRVTFGWLMRQLVMPRDPSRPPLVSVTFNLDPPLGGLRFAHLAHRLEANPRSAFQFDLGVNCDTSADGFRIICHYNCDLFDAVTIQGLLDQFRRLLELVVANPDEPLTGLAAPRQKIAPVVEKPRETASGWPDQGEAKTVKIVHAPRARPEPALEPVGAPGSTRNEKKIESARVPAPASAPAVSGNGGAVAVEDLPTKTLRIQYPPRAAIQSSKPATVTLAATKAAPPPALSLLHGPARPFPREIGIHEIFAAQAACAPDALAIDAGGERISYAQLDQRAEALAERLRAEGVAFGGSVGICLERSAEFIVSALAILKAGAAYAPLDPAYPSDRLASMIEDAAVGLIISRRPFNALPFPAETRILDLDVTQAPRLPSRARTAPRGVTGGDLAYVMFTSGSTGRPKGAQVLHRGISRLVVNSDYVEFTAGDVVAHVSNVSFDAATFEVWGALLNGASLVVVGNEALLSPRQFLAGLREKGVTVLFLTTPLFHQMAREAPDGFGFLRCLVVGGDALDPGAARLVLGSGQPPKALVNGYGPTETTTFAVCHQVTLPLTAASVPIGRPIANTQVYLLDADRHPVPLGGEGEIYIGGPGVARGYANRSGQTHLHFLADPYAEAGALMYKTGDRARILPDGTIEFLGRYDDQVKIRGFRVEPAEVEAVLRSHPEVGLCKVRAQAMADQEKALIGYVTARNGRVPQPRELRAFLKKRLPDYLIPRALVVLDHFPLTPNGKIDVAALPLPSSHSGGDQIAPRTEVEKGIAVLWQEILGPGSYSVTDDFFLSGGHSLLAIQLISRIAQRFDVGVPVRQLFETPTIKGLADFVQAELAPPGTDAFKLIVPIQRGNPKRRPLYLVPGGWGGEVEFLVYAQLARHIDLDLPVFGLRAHRNEKGQTTDDSVETMAANYLREIREFQPEGPYLLGGECVGGIIAYEMARQLDDEGEKTELLLMLDTDRPSAALRLWFSAFERSERWSAFWEWRVRQPFESHRVKLSRLGFAGKVRYVWDRLFRKRSWHSAEPSADDLRVLSEYPRKLMSHTPQPYRGKMTLLVDQKSHESNGALGWEGVHTGEIEVHIIPGDHISYIREHAPAAAEKLRAILARAK